MNNLANPQSPGENSRFEAFYSRVIPRMLKVMVISAGVLSWPAFRLYGWKGMIGFAAGSAVSYINFHLLVRGVEGLADRVVNRQSKEKGRVIVWRFLLRYGLVAIIAYAIFKGSALAFRGFLWGLCLPVVAMMIEAAVEAYVAFRN
jgi:ATP synthase I subunit